MRTIENNFKRGYYALWEGGSGYAPSSIEDLEKVWDLKNARELFNQRERNYFYGTSFMYVFKSIQYGVRTPCVERDSVMKIWFDLDNEILLHGLELPEPDRWIVFGPRGGIRTVEYPSDVYS